MYAKSIERPLRTRNNITDDKSKYLLILKVMLTVVQKSIIVKIIDKGTIVLTHLYYGGSPPPIPRSTLLSAYRALQPPENRNTSY